MFDECQAQRVRRIDLDAGQKDVDVIDVLVSPTSRAALESKLRQHITARYGSLPPEYQYDTVAVEVAATGSGIEHRPVSAEPDEHSYEFRLFASRPSQTQTIHLPSETHIEDGSNAGGFLVPQRRADYYFTTRADGERRARFLSAAVEGTEVRKWSQQRAWGLEMPWKVYIIRVTDTRSKVTAMSDARDLSRIKKRTKPGKKRRIVLRVRKRAQEVAEEQQRCENIRKAEAEREKRTCRNRKKKLKRRMKEKEAKRKVNTTAAPNNDVSLSGIES